MKLLVQALQVLAFLLAALTCAGLTYWIKGEPKRYAEFSRSGQAIVGIGEGEISLDQVLSEKKNVLWIDGRSRNDWQTDGLKDSIFISADPREDTAQLIDDHLQTLFEAQNEDYLVVVYCNQISCTDSKNVIRKISETFELRIFSLFGGYSALAGDPRVMRKND
jgi:hypothetical protein